MTAIRHLTQRAATTALAMLLTTAAALAQDTPDYSAWGTADGADGSQEHPYVITNTTGLDLLATEVNGGTSFYGKYFVLGDDITYSHTTNWNDAESTENNFTRIGTGSENFIGTFDGQGHTISGIRIYSTDNYQGLFGSIHEEGTVRNVILTDARITGQQKVGGIAGDSGGTVENCDVAADVFIGSAGDSPKYHGGIVGWSERGTVDGCTSFATLAQAQESGGIVGVNNHYGTVSNCRAVGAKLYGNSHVGAIVGCNNATLSHNYYYDCSIDQGNGTIKTSEIGTGDVGDVTDNDGAVHSEAIPLLDNYGNACLIAVCSNRLDEWGDPLSANYTLLGRTLYKDGSWNTICLPFKVWGGDIGTYLGSPTNIMELSSTSFEDGVLTLNFEEIDRYVGLQPGKPYIVRWDRADDYEDDNDHNLWQPTFKDVRASTATSPSTTDCVDFIGTCDPVTLAADDRTVLFLGADNKLYYPADAVTLGAFRGYFKLKDGLTMGDPDTSGTVKSCILNFGDETTEIKTTDYTDYTDRAGAWYDLSGRKIDGKPAQRGIYVNNGKKVVVK